MAQTVRYAESRGKDLAQLDIAELQRFSSAIGKDVFDALTLEGSMASRKHVGGTAPEAVRAAIQRARNALPRE